MAQRRWNEQDLYDKRDAKQLARSHEEQQASASAWAAAFKAVSGSASSV